MCCTKKHLLSYTLMPMIFFLFCRGRQAQYIASFRSCIRCRLLNFVVLAFACKIYFLQSNWGFENAVSKMMLHWYEFFIVDIGLYGNVFSLDYKPSAVYTSTMALSSMDMKLLSSVQRNSSDTMNAQHFRFVSQLAPHTITLLRRLFQMILVWLYQIMMRSQRCYLMERAMLPLMTSLQFCQSRQVRNSLTRISVLETR